MTDSEKRLLESLSGLSSAHSILLERCKKLHRDFYRSLHYGDIVHCPGSNPAADMIASFLDDVFLLENEE